MSAIFTRFRGWLARLFRRAPASAPQALGRPAAPPAPAAPEAPPAQPRRGAPQALADGQSFYHLGDLLEQLPDCRQLLRRLRRGDSDAARYHAVAGARILPHTSSADAKELKPQFLRVLPTAGMVYFPRFNAPPRADDMIPASLIYFQRFNSLHNVEPATGSIAVYRVSLAYFLESGRPALIIYHVALYPGGDIRFLREYSVRIVRLPRWHKVGSGKGRAPTYVRQATWVYPDLWDDAKAAKNPHGAVADVFRLVANFYDASNDDFQIRAERDGVSMAFNVHMGKGRTAYFFKDRDLEVTSDGRRKRIFHAVAEHPRTLPDGSTTMVAAHYRGARRFNWHGESVVITPPENAMRQFNVAAEDVERHNSHAGFMTGARAAAMARRGLESAPVNRRAT